MTKVLMVSGSWPPQVCGVGDYTERLCFELEQSGVGVVRFVDDGLSRLYSSKAVRRADEVDCDVVHIQYPTAGYGRSLTPGALPWRVRNKPVVVTLHEYSVFRWYRRAWFSPYARHCAARVFTTDEERSLFQRRFPSRGGADLTIEIASNIPAAANTARNQNRVSYFGLIAPNKGIEAFLELSESARASSDEFVFELIGAIPEQHRRYAAAIMQRASASKVEIAIDLPNDAVAERLAASAFAYLPFPDGASAKRGTLAAAIVNRLIVITRHSDITPGWIRSATLDARRPEDALKLLLLLRTDNRKREAAAKQGALAVPRFRWDTIARRHAELYRSLLNSAANGASDAPVWPSAATSSESRMAS
jgi:glycosyltransferase involved in cell wall biosynthesis